MHYLCKKIALNVNFKSLHSNKTKSISALRGSEFSSYETELRKMMSHFELLTQKSLEKFFFLVTNSAS